MLSPRPATSARTRIRPAPTTQPDTPDTDVQTAVTLAELRGVLSHTRALAALTESLDSNHGGGLLPADTVRRLAVMVRGVQAVALELAAEALRPVAARG